MFGERMKEIRKRRGLTQEELAVRLNVVRQTVSKWEKGLSVPDADMLQKMAEILDTDVSELLGGDRRDAATTNEIAEQLSRINEQLAVRNKRWRRVLKWVLIFLAVLLALKLLLISLNFVIYSARMEEGPVIEETETAGSESGK